MEVFVSATSCSLRPQSARASLNLSSIRPQFAPDPRHPDQFQAIRTLGTLLTSTDTTTLAVACHDGGEFVRLHPVGKRMCMKMGIKASVMTLMAQPEREVA